MTTTVRDGSLSDYDFLVEMMIEAAHWMPGTPKPSPKEAAANEKLAPYFVGWGKPGDHMSIAGVDGELAGCAWYRSFTADKPGHGFLSEDIPELGIACRAQFRGQGVGRIVLDHMCDHARAQGIPKICLSASTENYACKLYYATGFEIVWQQDDRVTMVKVL